MPQWQISQDSGKETECQNYRHCTQQAKRRIESDLGILEGGDSFRIFPQAKAQEYYICSIRRLASLDKFKSKFHGSGMHSCT